MNTALPESITKIADKLMVSRFWWDGLQVNIPKHCVYAIIPNPVSDYYSNISGIDVPVLKMGKYHIPIWDPMQKKLAKMPKYAVVLTHQDGNRFGLYAYPADCIDEEFDIPYDEWFERQDH